uniref:DUF4939 domain-containing protein n=1 Tax=Mastacembelus armatus TaxID=205130 RepID=A0A3Q3RMT8_9TELE
MIELALHSQGRLLGEHDRMLRALMDTNHQLLQQVAQLTDQMRIRSCLRDTPVPDPSPYSGEPDKCRSFIFQCTNVFKARPSSFSTDLSKLLFFSGLLRDEALTWVGVLASPFRKPGQNTRWFLPAIISIGTQSHSLSALIDSGADDNFLDSNLAQ